MKSEQIWMCSLNMGENDNRKERNQLVMTSKEIKIFNSPFLVHNLLVLTSSALLCKCLKTWRYWLHIHCDGQGLTFKLYMEENCACLFRKNWNASCKSQNSCLHSEPSKNYNLGRSDFLRNMVFMMGLTLSLPCCKHVPSFLAAYWSPPFPFSIVEERWIEIYKYKV